MNKRSGAIGLGHGLGTWTSELGAQHSRRCVRVDRLASFNPIPHKFVDYRTVQRAQIMPWGWTHGGRWLVIGGANHAGPVYLISGYLRLEPLCTGHCDSHWAVDWKISRL